METRSLNPQALPFIVTSSPMASANPYLLPSIPPFPRHEYYQPHPQTLFPPHPTTYFIPSQPAVMPGTQFIQFYAPPPPPPLLTYSNPNYVIQPSLPNLQQGLTPRPLLVYNISNQQQTFVPSPVETYEQISTPESTHVSRVNDNIRVGPRCKATNNGIQSSGGRSYQRPPRRRNERRGSLTSMAANTKREEGFGNGGSGQYMHNRYRKDLSIKKEKHQIIPLKADEAKTTVMIKHIPYGYNRDKLIKMLDEFCYHENQKASKNQPVCAYDFVYLPFDFGTRKSIGYAFVNFTTPGVIWKFVEVFHNKKWWFDGIPKTTQIVSAKIQGKDALVNSFKNSIFECDSDKFLPVCFNPPRDGSGSGSSPQVLGYRYARDARPSHY